MQAAAQPDNMNRATADDWYKQRRLTQNAMDVLAQVERSSPQKLHGKSKRVGRWGEPDCSQKSRPGSQLGSNTACGGWWRVVVTGGYWWLWWSSRHSVIRHPRLQPQLHQPLRVVSHLAVRTQRRRAASSLLYLLPTYCPSIPTRLQSENHTQISANNPYLVQVLASTFESLSQIS